MLFTRFWCSWTSSSRVWLCSLVLLDLLPRVALLLAAPLAIPKHSEPFLTMSKPILHAIYAIPVLLDLLLPRVALLLGAPGPPPACSSALGCSPSYSSAFLTIPNHV